MVYKLVLLLALVGVVSSKLRHRHVCDPVPPQKFPSHCSNYENTVELDKRQTALEQQLESANSDITALKILLTNLSSALNDLESRKAQGEMEFKQSKAELEKHQADIASLKTEVHKLVRHREFVGGNFSEIEKKLDTTEKELRKKKAKLEDLETETEAAFNDTRRLLSQYRSELSNFSAAAQELGVKVEDRLNVTRTELETKVDKIQRDNNGTFKTNIILTLNSLLTSTNWYVHRTTYFTAIPNSRLLIWPSPNSCFKISAQNSIRKKFTSRNL